MQFLRIFHYLLVISETGWSNDDDCQNLCHLNSFQLVIIEFNFHLFISWEAMR